jgi:hypothetical protein
VSPSRDSSVAFVAGDVASGVFAGMRRRLTGSSQPSCVHGPLCVVRFGADVASVVWPSSHVPRTRIPVLLTVVDGMHSVTVHASGRPTSHTEDRMAATVANDLLPRIEKAAKEVRDSEKLLRADRETRRRLVVEAADSGIAHRAIARALGGGTGLVSKILGTPEPEE